MSNLTFEQVPEALSRVLIELSELRRILTHQQHPQLQQDELLTIQQASSLLNLSVATIYGLVSRADIPHSKKGKRLYFSKQELLAWVYTGRRKTSVDVQAEADKYLNNKRR
ncbi:MAG: DNA-binding protein [Sphingobacteriales bacterium]|nr:MAG: DNA-binding protein [Sphingobacteriales bacterium]